LLFLSKNSQISRPNAETQKDMLLGGLSDILFRAADGKEAFVCMIGPEMCFEPTSNFGNDGYTEKVDENY
jgi:hypothetical protein